MASDFSRPGTNVITTLRGILARCLGYSRTFNTRNLEHYWYPSWNHTLVDLTADNPRLVVAPQFPLYISPDQELEEPDHDVDEELDESEEGGGIDDDGPWIDGAAGFRDGDDNEDEGDADNTDDVEQPLLYDAPSDDSDELMADVSFSTASTTPEAKALTRVTDFAILHITYQDNAAFPRPYEGYRVDQLKVPLILEEKRFPSRSLIGDAFTDKLQAKVREAQQAAVFQAALLFREFPAMELVMVIAASGPYWTNTVFRRAPNSHLSADEFKKVMRISDYAELYRTVDHRRWSIPLRLNTAASTRRFRAIHNNLAGLG